MHFIAYVNFVYILETQFMKETQRIENFKISPFWSQK